MVCVMMLRAGVDFEHLKSQITSRTRAIIAIDLFGHPAGLADLKALADQHGLYLIARHIPLAVL